MGRFTAELLIANNRDVLRAQPGDEVKRVSLGGIVDSGASKLVLPSWVVDQLDLLDDGEATVRFADQRAAKRRLVSNVWLEVLGRQGVFSAIVEPARQDALIGAIVLEELDLIVDCGTGTLQPRDPNSTITEIGCLSATRQETTSSPQIGA